MKQIVFIIAVLSVVSCKKSSTPTPSTTTPPTTTTKAVAKFIPNWHDNDTLYGIELDASSQPTGKSDTIFTKNVNDTSFIVYHGKQYYIWEEPLTNLDTFKNNQLQYGNVIISPDKTVASAISNSPLNGAAPYRYIDQQGNWSYQYQAMMVNDSKNFKKVSGDYYTSRRQYK